MSDWNVSLSEGDYDVLSTIASNTHRTVELLEEIRDLLKVGLKVKTPLHIDLPFCAECGKKVPEPPGGGPFDRLGL